MLELALTEYCVSICYVNLLYSYCILPEANDKLKVYIINLWKN